MGEGGGKEGAIHVLHVGSQSKVSEGGERRGQLHSKLVAKHKVGKGGREGWEELVVLVSKDEVSKVGRKLDDWRVVGVAKGEMGDGRREGAFPIIQFYNHIRERGRKGINNGSVGELPASDQVSERGGEIEGLVESPSKYEVSDRGREMGDTLIDVLAKSEMGKGRR